MSRERIRDEAGRLSRPGSKVRCEDVGEQVAVILEPYTLPVAAVYSSNVIEALAFLVPAIYPDAVPDTSGFYIKPRTLTVMESKGQPQATNADADLLGEKWMKFSWGPKGPQFDPTRDSLETHLATLEGRFLRKN
ncbi:MAG: hypothetical protein IT347_11805 [Candidatus Eisenbacteria bacterium]|nr:hypothetical protein [Candidatus Eisenbacteria bacterium]